MPGFLPNFVGLVGRRSFDSVEEIFVNHRRKQDLKGLERAREREEERHRAKAIERAILRQQGDVLRYRGLVIRELDLNGDPRRESWQSRLIHRGRRSLVQPQGAVCLSDYVTVRNLKEGGMSDRVDIVENQRTGKLYVAKTVRLGRGIELARAKAELEVFKRIRKYRGEANLNLMSDYFWDRKAEVCTYVLELCDLGTLEDLIIETFRAENTLSEDFLWHALQGLASALAFLHWGVRSSDERPKKGWDTICHLDIKPGNIFLQDSGDEFPRIVLGDYNCAVTFGDIKNPRTIRYVQQACYTPGWTAPEGSRTHLGRQAKYGPITDIWTVGAVIQCMGRLMIEPDLRSAGTPDVVGQSYGSRLNNIVGRMTTHLYNSRPSALEVLDVAERRARRHGR